MKLVIAKRLGLVYGCDTQLYARSPENASIVAALARATSGHLTLRGGAVRRVVGRKPQGIGTSIRDKSWAQIIHFLESGS